MLLVEDFIGNSQSMYWVNVQSFMTILEPDLIRSVGDFTSKFTCIPYSECNSQMQALPLFYHFPTWLYNLSYRTFITNITCRIIEAGWVRGALPTQFLVDPRYIKSHNCQSPIYFFPNDILIASYPFDLILGKTTETLSNE